MTTTALAEADRPRFGLIASLATVGVLALAGCGSDGSDGSSPTTARPVSTTASTSTTTPSPSTTVGSTEPPATTVPAGDGPTLDAAAAEAEIRSLGDWAPDMSTYDPAATLSAVKADTVGAASAASPEQIFFFHEGRYLGTATSTSRVALAITDSTPDSATVTYGNYATDDAYCCPSKDPYVVTFRWDGSRVVSEGKLPPEDQGLG